ncbi:esterase [Periweissella cryptocerci]|uniref:Esterase n=1 Tax=Periweissella cryptocerci TaxID=2506420 RepID=A0A4P6YU61_9LACO|nr:GDSL-type esterase/lipase family protein [Periweissella cryptocerci]QBO36319.1 esterase [Periweissella cryptocerci]
MKIVLLGDSLTARYEGANEPMLSSKLKPLIANDDVILNYGVSGEDTNDVVKRLAPIAQATPDIIFVMLGSNDARFMRVPLTEYRDNLVKIITTFGDSQVVLVTAPPVDESKQFPKRKNVDLAEYATTVQMLAVEYKLSIIDFYHILSNKPNMVEYVHGQLDDGLHIGTMAYGLLAELYADEISKAKKE